MMDEEAIKILSHTTNLGYGVVIETMEGYTTRDIKIALDMAIEALGVRPQGEWIALKLPITEEEGDIKIICSNCKDEFIGQNDLETWINVYHYCPSCGAEMKGKEE